MTAPLMVPCRRTPVAVQSAEIIPFPVKDDWRAWLATVPDGGTFPLTLFGLEFIAWKDTSAPYSFVHHSIWNYFFSVAPYGSNAFPQTEMVTFGRDRQYISHGALYRVDWPGLNFLHLWSWRDAPANTIVIGSDIMEGPRPGRKLVADVLRFPTQKSRRRRALAPRLIGRLPSAAIIPEARP